ncbi:MAG: T9SS type A sorting domain-containing protein [Bacteroidales bacterium]
MVRTITLFLFIFGMLGLSAQTRFQKSAGTSANDRNYHLASGPYGSLYATGYTESVTGNLTDAFLVKYNRFGEVQWAKTYGDSGHETNWDVIVTQNNEIVGVGYSSDLSTYEGGIITRADTMGNVIWSRGVVSLAGSVNFYRVIETVTGDLIATGLTSRNNQDDMVLCKFSSSGTLLWSKVIGTPQADEVMGLIETTQGHYLLAGLTDDASGNGGSEFAVVKTDQSGNVIWKKRYGGTGSDRLNSVVEMMGQYYFLGWTPTGGIGSNDVAVMKTDTAGNIIWNYAYGTAQTERAFNMLADPFNPGGLVVAGYTDYSDSVTNNRNTFLMTLDGTTGNMLWARSYGSTGTDGHWPTGLAMHGINDDIGYYVLGSTNTFGQGSYSLYLTKTDIDGNTGCNQKDPQFTQQAIAGWTGAAFGTDSVISLMSVNITISGDPWIITSSTQCCLLSNELGADVEICPGVWTSLGDAAIPGYGYNWVYSGTTVGTTSVHNVDWQNAGSYVLTVSAANSGCSSLSDTVGVIPLPAPPKPTISANGNYLTSSAPDSNQWFMNGVAIPGATQQVYHAWVTGQYHVRVRNQYHCESYSDSLYHVAVGVESHDVPEMLSMYPNPVLSALHLQFGRTSSDVQITCYSLHGIRILEQYADRVDAGGVIGVDTGSLPPGVYHIRISSGEGVITKKFSVVR